MRTTALLGLVTATMMLAACSDDPKVCTAERAEDCAAPGTGAPKPEEPTKSVDPVLPSTVLAAGLRVKDIAVFQGMKVPVVEDGKTHQGALSSPVVANRPGILRVYVEATGSFKPADVTAVLRLISKDNKDLATISVTKKIGGSSTEADAGSTFNIEFPASVMPEGASFQVWLTTKDGAPTDDTATSDARYPQNGSLWQDLGAVKSGSVKVMLVPIAYNADHSGRLPVTTDDQIKHYKDTLMAKYPTSEIDITLHKPFAYAAGVAANGRGWDELLAAISNLRDDDKPTDEIYYYGVFNPSDKFRQYCAGGCVAGLSYVGSLKGSSLRSSIGMGYAPDPNDPDSDSAETMAHELGHAHGRNHAPCGPVDGADTAFPHPGATLGTWGYDFLAKTFFSPDDHHDMMAYCKNNWVSDYTYNALFKRIKELNAYAEERQRGTSAHEQLIGHAAPASGFSVASINADGDARWRRDTTEDIDEGEERTAKIIGAHGEVLRTTTARFFPYDHVAGGLLYVPKAPNETFTQVEVQGFGHRLAH